MPAVGLSGADAGILLVRRRPPVEVEGQAVDYGMVGDPVSTRVDVLRALLEKDYVPVVCPLGIDSEGRILNVNADTVAMELAVGLSAAKLFFVTDKPGILHDPNDPASVYSTLSIADIRRLIGDKVISGGMLPKANAGVAALQRGVQRVHIVGASEPDALLDETFTNQGCGTMLVSEHERAAESQGRPGALA